MKKTLVHVTCDTVQQCQEVMEAFKLFKKDQLENYEFIVTTRNIQMATLEAEILSKAKELASSIIIDDKHKPDKDAYYPRKGLVSGTGVQRASQEIDELKRRCQNTKNFKVEIKDVFMIPFGENTIKVNDIMNGEKTLLMENDYIQSGCPKFLKDPLMWIAYKIIKRRFHKNKYRNNRIR